MEYTRHLPLVSVSRDVAACALVVGIVLICMTTGVLDAAGIAPAVSNIVTTALAVALLALGVLGQRRTQLAQAFALTGPLLLAAIVGLLGGALRGAPPLEILLFAREMLTPVLLLLAFWYAPLDEGGARRIGRLLLLLVVVQIAVSLAKMASVGVNEKGWIGTMTQSAGQLGLLMPSLALGFIWAFGLIRSRVFAAGVLAMLVALVGVISEKRAMMFLACGIPLFVLATWWVVARIGSCEIQGCRRRTLSYLLSASVVAVLVAAASLVLIPSLKGDGARFERYGTEGTFEYILEYLTRDYDSPMNVSKTSVEDNPNIQLGRLVLLSRAVEDSVAQRPHLALAGQGGGWLIEHRLLAHKGDDVLYDHKGLRGPGGLLIRHLFEIGWLGVGLVLAWIAGLAYLLLRRISRAPEFIPAYGALVGLAVLTFDYIFYSEMAWNSGIFMPILLLLVVAALRPISLRGVRRGD